MSEVSLDRLLDVGDLDLAETDQFDAMAGILIVISSTKDFFF